MSSTVLATGLSFVSTDGSVTGVGAIRLFFVCLPSSTSGTACKSLFFLGETFSSRSDSLSRRGRPDAPARPLTELLALWVLWPWAGVRGGVNIGTPPTGPELVAARPGTADIDGVGAFMTPMSPAPGANDDAVAMLETELLRVGLPGLAGTNELGDAGKPAEGCLVIGGAVAVAAVGMLEVVGVGVGVEWLEARDATVSIEGVCVCLVSFAVGPVYLSPSSPAAKVNDEQNPSEEVINNVDPSLDLGLLVTCLRARAKPTYQVRSVKVAKCKLLTMHKGFCCCVSYTCTASCVATAYTIRYGKLKAETGPGGGLPGVPTSPSTGFGDAAATLGEGEGALVSGGGSMEAFEVGALDGMAGSGNAGISSSADEVSMVICFVAG